MTGGEHGAATPASESILVPAGARRVYSNHEIQVCDSNDPIPQHVIITVCNYIV